MCRSSPRQTRLFEILRIRMAFSDRNDQINTFVSIFQPNKQQQCLKHKQFARSIHCKKAFISIYINMCYVVFLWFIDLNAIHSDIKCVSLCSRWVCFWVTRKNTTFFYCHLQQVSNAMRFVCCFFPFLSPSLSLRAMVYRMNRVGSVLLRSLKEHKVLYGFGFGFNLLFNHVDCVWVFSLRIFIFIIYYFFLSVCLLSLNASFFFRLCHACTRCFGAFDTHQKQQQQKTFTFHCSSYHVSLQ